MFRQYLLPFSSQCCMYEYVKGSVPHGPDAPRPLLTSPLCPVRMLYVLIYETEIVPVILCGSEIWCLTSREEHRLRVIKSMVVRRMLDVRGR